MSIEEQKEMAYYSANLQAFWHSMFERNKQLLIISYLTVGLLFVFVQGLKEHLDILFWFAVQGVFVVNILILFWVINLNAKYFKYVLKYGKDGKDNYEQIQLLENKIGIVSRISFLLFLLGIVLAFWFTYLFLKGLIL